MGGPCTDPRLWAHARRNWIGKVRLLSDILLKLNKLLSNWVFCVKYTSINITYHATCPSCPTLVTNAIVWCPHLILMVLEKFFLKLLAVTNLIWRGAQLSMVRAPAITNLLRTFWFYFQRQHSSQMVTLERPLFLPRFVFSTPPSANPWCFPSLLPIRQLSLPMSNSQPVIKPNAGFKKKIILV